MAVLSALTLIRVFSIFHITLAFYILTDPHVIADQNIVFLLGESMHLPPIHGFDKPTGITAFLALVLGLVGLSDFTAASMTENVALEYWGSQIPIRLIYFFVITAYTYLFKNDGLTKLGKSYKPNVGDHLKNGLIFSWGFVEILMWFWIYLGVREDRRQAAVRTLQERASRRDD